MAYATLTDLQSRIGEPRLQQLTDLGDPPVGLVVPDVAINALDDASAEIDGYLMGRYTVPIDPAPEVMRVWCVKLAHYLLLGSSADATLTADITALRSLWSKFAQGLVPLFSPSETPAVEGVGQVLFSPGAKVMGRESGGY